MRILTILLLLELVFIVLFRPVMASAESCLNVDPKTTHMYLSNVSVYPFLTDNEQKLLADQEQQLCTEVRKGKIKENGAVKIFIVFHWIFAMCDGAEPSKAFWHDTYSWDPPPTAWSLCSEIDIFKQFELVVEVHRDILCLWAQDIANGYLPGLAIEEGPLLKLLQIYLASKNRDNPNVKRTAESLRTLCQQFRAGDIDLPSANYQFEREMKILAEQVPMDYGKAMKDYAKRAIVNIFKGIMALAILISTIVGILVTLKNLLSDKGNS